MEINIRNYNPEKFGVKFMQEGGAMPADGAPAGAPVEEAPAQEQDQMGQLIQIFQQGLEGQDCNLLAQGAQMFLSLAGGAQEAAAPEQPVYRRGGTLVRRIKK